MGCGDWRLLFVFILIFSLGYCIILSRLWCQTAASIDCYYTEGVAILEGDVSMMICTGDTVPGTKKRESQSEAFANAPFDYAFSPIPLTDDSGYFIDSPSVEFSVNKSRDDLDMTNEFMRFLISDEEVE